MNNSKNDIADEAQKMFQKNATAYYNSYRYGSLKKLTGEFKVFVKNNILVLSCEEIQIRFILESYQNFLYFEGKEEV